jgi:all-trans-8'-apo-beta-carotenal 15,15'-oxygenase
MHDDFCPGIEKWLLFEAVEDSHEVVPSEGRVPDWVRGSYYLNGPARFFRGELAYRHWLDGDGMVRALHFQPSGIQFVSRFVSTRKRQIEEEAGRAVFRTFGTSFPGDRLRRNVMLEPPVNVSVYTLGARLLAFAEQSIPYQLDPSTLETLGEFDFGGRLNEVTPFAAHAKLDPESGRLVNFGISFSSTNPVLYLYEFDPDGTLAGRRRFPVRAPHTNHDFAISRRHAAFFLSPLEMNFERFWTGGASVMESLQWRPEKGSYILVVPRVGQDSQAFSLNLEGGHCLHLINAHEAGNDLVLDLVEYEEPIYPEYQPVPDFYQDISPGRPVRYRIDLQTQRPVERIEMRYDRSPDFPSVDPRLVSRQYDDFWMLGLSKAGRKGRKFFDELVHCRWSQPEPDIYRAPEGRYFGGEPILIPRAGESAAGGGLILIQEFDSQADRMDFLLFEGRKVQAGPIARLPLRHKTHPGFHASYEYR